jgi:hypothetical protein
MTVNYILFGVVLAVVALVPSTSVSAQNTPRQATALVVDGNVENRLSLSVGDLRRLPMHQVEDERQMRMSGAQSTSSGAARRYAGCCCAT